MKALLGNLSDADIRLLRIYEGTSQIQQLVIARRTLAQRAA